MFDSTSGRRARQRKAGLHRIRYLRQRLGQQGFEQFIRDFVLAGNAGRIAKAAARRKRIAESLCTPDCQCATHRIYVEQGVEALEALFRDVGRRDDAAEPSRFSRTVSGQCSRKPLFPGG